MNETSLYPFLVTVNQKIYVHQSRVSTEAAFEAYKGNMDPVRDQIQEEVRKTDPSGDAVVHGMLAWGASYETISLSEYPLTMSSS